MEVNTDDIADGAVTSSKANFIKFYTIQSGSNGWNPGAGQANMDIAGPDLNDITESSVIVVNVDDDKGLHVQCAETKLSLVMYMII